MDLRWLLLLAVIVGVMGFLLGRRTAPTGRALHRLQRQLDAKQQELHRHQQDMSRFVSEMQGEMERVAKAYRDVQQRLRQPDSSAPISISPAPLVPASRPARRAGDVLATALPAASAEWPARLAGSEVAIGNRGGPSLASAAACPLPEYGMLEAPKDYPAGRRNGGYDEHAYA